MALPNSDTDGGSTANTCASRMELKLCRARPTMAWARLFAPLRSFQSLKCTNDRPALCDWPVKEKPATVNSPSTLAFSSTRKWCSSTLSTSCVRFSVAPGGSCTRAKA